MPNATYEVLLYGQHMTFNPNITELSTGESATINVICDAGYHAKVNDISGCSYTVDNPSNVKVVTLSNPYNDIEATFVAELDPTPVTTEDYCYVERLKKFITRMAGKKISQGE